jgi:hypothetical protein
LCPPIRETGFDRSDESPVKTIAQSNQTIVTNGDVTIDEKIDDHSTLVPKCRTTHTRNASKRTWMGGVWPQQSAAKIFLKFS